MFLFSGTFFPLAQLPVYLQWIGWISPLWHGTELGRVASYGMAEPVWLSMAERAGQAAARLPGLTAGIAARSGGTSSAA